MSTAAESLKTESPADGSTGKAPTGKAPKPADSMPPVDVQSRIVGELLTPSALATILHLPKTVSATGATGYLDQFINDSKKAADPIERVVIEQIAVAHHRLISLHIQAAAQKDLMAVAIYNASAARLSTELRRLIETLKKYRAPQEPKDHRSPPSSAHWSAKRGCGWDAGHPVRRRREGG